MEIKNEVKLKAINDKNMSNGMRNTSKTPLSPEEIAFVKSEIRRIEADESVFVFNEVGHISLSTCYNFVDDKIYVTRNVFPDDKFGSTHPRDLMSVGAVLAHEYYGHRSYRSEYLEDLNQEGDFHSTPLWKDECRASITAARITPNLTERDKSNLVMDAVYRAKEYGHLIEMDDFMKEVLYGYTNREKNISYNIPRINYISEPSENRKNDRGTHTRDLSKMSRTSRDYDDFERWKNDNCLQMRLY